MITCIAPKRNIFFALLYTINTYKENQFLGNFCKNIIIFSIENFPWHLASMSVANYSTNNNQRNNFKIITRP